MKRRTKAEIDAKTERFFDTEKFLDYAKNNIDPWLHDFVTSTDFQIARIDINYGCWLVIWEVAEKEKVPPIAILREIVELMNNPVEDLNDLAFQLVINSYKRSRIKMRQFTHAYGELLKTVPPVNVLNFIKFNGRFHNYYFLVYMLEEIKKEKYTPLLDKVITTYEYLLEIMEDFETYPFIPDEEAIDTLKRVNGNNKENINIKLGNARARKAAKEGFRLVKDVMDQLKQFTNVKSRQDENEYVDLLVELKNQQFFMDTQQPANIFFKGIAEDLDWGNCSKAERYRLLFNFFRITHGLLTKEEHDEMSKGASSRNNYRSYRERAINKIIT